MRLTFTKTMLLHSTPRGGLWSSVGAYYDPALVSSGYHDGLKVLSHALSVLCTQDALDEVGLRLTQKHMEQLVVYTKSLRKKTVYGSFNYAAQIPMLSEGKAVPEIRPVIVLNANRLSSVIEALSTLAHELVHYEQFAMLRMSHIGGDTLFEGRVYSAREKRKIGYSNQPWEVEAFNREGELAKKLYAVMSREITDLPLAAKEIGYKR